MRSGNLATPISIVVAGAFVGAGLVLGLRGRQPEAPAPARASGPARARGVPALEAPASPPVSQEKIAAEAAAGLEAQRAALVKKCWHPSVLTQPTPTTMLLTYNFTFDAQGNQVLRGVSVDRATGRADVIACLNGLVQPIHVSPPGASTYVEVPFTLP